MNENKTVDINLQEREAKKVSGMAVLILGIIVMIAAVAVCVVSLAAEQYVLAVIGILVFVIDLFLLCGLKVLKPNEAYVLTLFGKYHGTLKGPGFYWVTPFATASSPAGNKSSSGFVITTSDNEKAGRPTMPSNKLSLKTMTLNNARQKINDQLGNPIEIGIIVIWRVVNTAKAMFNVESYNEFLSIQCDSALRNIVRLYPYDITGGDDENEKSLRGSSQEIADKLRGEIQKKVEIAGLEIMEARITHLAYAPEIAAAMLQRQQAAAVIDARQMIVDGAVGMVEMALKKLSENNVVELDEERKAAMVSNLLVVLCGNKDAQPIVNSGSIY